MTESEPDPTPAGGAAWSTTSDLTVAGEPVGWRVLSPNGTVVASGPGMTLIAVGDSGPAPETEES